MYEMQIIIILIAAATAIWLCFRLERRVALLEHEVRWLRQELESLKPTEVISQYDPGPRS